METWAEVREPAIVKPVPLTFYELRKTPGAFTHLCLYMGTTTQSSVMVSPAWLTMAQRVAMSRQCASVRAHSSPYSAQQHGHLATGNPHA